MNSMVQQIQQVMKPILANVHETEMMNFIWDAIPCFGFDFAMLAIGMVLSVCLLTERRLEKDWKARGHAAKKLAVEEPSCSTLEEEEVAAPESSTVSETCDQLDGRLISNCVAEGQWEEALSLVSKVHSKDSACELDEEVIHALLSKCVDLGSPEESFHVESLARAQARTLSDSTYSWLLKAFLGNHLKARSIVQEVLARDDPCFSRELVQSMLRVCKRHEKPLADKVFDRMQTAEPEMLSIFISYYLDTHQHEKACNVFELNFAAFFDEDMDADLEWRLMSAALQCGHQALAQQLYETSPYNYPASVTKIQNWWKRTAEQGGPEAFRIRRMHDQRSPEAYLLPGCLRFHDN